MGYNIHITIGDSWVDETYPISLEDIEEVMSMLPDGFRVNESGLTTMKTPQGQTMSMDIGPNLEYTDEEGKVTNILFPEDRCPYFRFQSKKQLLGICAVAEALGAKLQGDDDEIYTREQLEKELE